MTFLRRNLRADPRLLFPLTQGETRITLPLGDAVISAALKTPRQHTRGAVVFVHGAASNASRWEELVERSSLGSAHALARLDLRGHGASPSLRPGRLEQHADDILALMGACSMKQAVIVGHSLGASIALELAIRSHERMAGLVLIDPLLKECLTQETLARRSWLPLLRAVSLAASVAEALGLERSLKPCRLRAMDAEARRLLSLGDEAAEAFVKSYSSALGDLKHTALGVYVRDLMEAARPTPDLSRICCPMLILGAASGVYTDPAALEREAIRAGAAFRLLPCRHWPVTECLPEVMCAIEEWIGGV